MELNLRLNLGLAFCPMTPRLRHQFEAGGNDPVEIGTFERKLKPDAFTQRIDQAKRTIGAGHDESQPTKHLGCIIGFLAGQLEVFATKKSLQSTCRQTARKEPQD